MSTDADLIAAFLAAKGATKIPTGERTTTERGMWKAVRGIEDVRPRIDVVIDHAGREFRRNEAGEWI